MSKVHIVALSQRFPLSVYLTLFPYIFHAVRERLSWSCPNEMSESITGPDHNSLSQSLQIEEPPMEHLSFANGGTSAYTGDNWQPRVESPGLRARHSIDNVSSDQPTVDDRDEDLGSAIPTTDLRYEAATFRRRQAQMLPICILNNWFGG